MKEERIRENVCCVCKNYGKCVDFKENVYNLYYCERCKRFWSIISNKVHKTKKQEEQ